MELVQLKSKAKQASGSTQKVFQRIKKKPPQQLDHTMEQLHEEVFSTTDCLSCANCCKTTSPVFTGKDIERIAKFFRLKPGQFISQYLHIDEDNDYVLNVSPCPFLNTDNTCQVYEQRPQACREYPHTNRKKFHQILDLTLRNTYICPATFKIIERLKSTLPSYKI
jgi:Fe-S-cluster containining protein